MASDIDFCPGVDQSLSELNIVLLGSNHAGKSSAGNTILNREEFELKRTAQCVKRQREVTGRHITVVEAPGWRWNIPPEESTELLKEEIVLSVSMCPPGPHALLLVISTAVSFKEIHRYATEGYLKLLGDTVWSHTIVLFIYRDWLGDTPIEQHIENEGKELQWLVEKCGNRYHVLNNENRSDDTQVTELLEKIEEMVAANSGRHFEIDRKILQEVEQKRRAEEERAKERMMKVQNQKMKIRSQISEGQNISELRILLLGHTDAGKSSSGNTILNREEFELKRTAQCVKRQGEAAGRHITVVEAPGWWINEPVTELLQWDIVLCMSLCSPGPQALLLMVRTDSKYEDKFTEDITEYLTILGDGVWSHTIVLFTCGDCLGDTPIEQHIESEGKELQWLVEKCGNRYHVLNNQDRSDDTQVTELLEKIEEMVAANSGNHFELDRKILQEVEETKKREKRAIDRMIKVQKQREDIRCQMSDSHRLSELRIVLLGYRGAGKSSAGNSILNREEFELKRTAQCVKRQREVAGRHITVVEAPGWWMNVPVEDSTELLKQQIVLSVSLCPPGPHAVLLVIQVKGVFKDYIEKVLDGYLDLLTETVWNHTLILFTFGDCLGDTPIEQHIESEGKELQWLVEKCGNRYQVLNNKNRSDDTQVTELLEKIEEMVAANSGCHFELDRMILQEVEEKRRAEEERAKERMMKVQKQREHIRSWMGGGMNSKERIMKVKKWRKHIRSQMRDTHHLSELRIILLGYRGAGKSSAGNTILNSEEFELKRTAQCVKRQGEVAGRHITVVEAPGWWSNKPVEESTELLKQEIVLSVSLCPPGLHAVLLVIRVKSVFKDYIEKVIDGYLDLLTETVWNHTLILFTFGDRLGDTPIELHIEKQLQWLVEKCGNRYHVLNNKNRSDDTQVTELLEKIEEMVAANSGRPFEMDRTILQEVEEKRRAEEERAKERMMKVQKQREHIRSWMGDTHHLSELRIILLGYRGAGKSSAGNTILNREEFKLKRTAQCVKRQREVAGRLITVVEAPGWWSNKPVEESTELLKQEIVLSVSLCPPGPHAVLLVIRVKSIFKNNIEQVLDGYLELLTDSVWSHTIVLFTFGDYLLDTPIEQHIESEGKELQWLVEKCRNRYHVLNNVNRSDDTQVTELLEKIEEMVAASSGRHFELDRKMLLEVEEKRRAEEERAKERMMKVQKQREHIRSQMGGTHLSELRIVLLGSRDAGKSSAGNTILNREEFELKRTAQCVKRQREVAGRLITVVEAPGWWRNKPVEENTELLKQEMVLSVSLCPPGPHALMLIIRLGSVFKTYEKEMLNGYVELLSKRVWSHTIVLFTCGDRLLDTPIEQHIEREGKELQWLVEKCGNRYHVLNNEDRSDDTQVTELLEKIEEMVAANNGCHFELDRKILQEVEEKKRAEEERAKERMMMWTQKEHNISFLVTEAEISDTLSLASSGYHSMSRSDSSSVYGLSHASSDESLTRNRKKNLHHLITTMPRKIPLLLPFFRRKKRSARRGGSTMEKMSKSESNDSDEALSGDNVSYCDLLVDDCSSASAQQPYTEHLSMATVRFLPEVVEENSEFRNITFHRFLCPHAGQFQCKLTNLVFEMEGEGEVLYRIDFWDTRLLDGLGQMEPAGPLYSIDCYGDLISHLHLPHSELQYDTQDYLIQRTFCPSLPSPPTLKSRFWTQSSPGDPQESQTEQKENQGELVVAHVTEENIEIIPPLKVTDTHVVISIQGLSLFGLLKKITYPSPISAQVLLFYEEIMCKESRKKLHIHLLPGNVPVEEVEKKHKGATYYETSSTCQLIAGKKYKPSCEPYASEPKVATFERDYGPKYHPTFVVFLEAEDIIVSIMDEDGEEVWEPHKIFLTSEKTVHSPETSPLTMEGGPEFVDKNRQKLIQRVPSVMEIVDCLQCKNMVTDETYSNIQTAKTSEEQMRILYGALDSGGAAVKAEFYEILQKKVPYLVEDLEAGPSEA